MKSKTSTVSADRARRFCRALFEETNGEPRWRMVDTIARRLGVPFDEAEATAEDCARRSLVDHRMHSVTLREGGRREAQVFGNTRRWEPATYAGFSTSQRGDEWRTAARLQALS